MFFELYDLFVCSWMGALVFASNTHERRTHKVSEGCPINLERTWHENEGRFFDKKSVSILCQVGDTSAFRWVVRLSPRWSSVALQHLRLSAARMSVLTAVRDGISMSLTSSTLKEALAHRAVEIAIAMAARSVLRAPLVGCDTCKPNLWCHLPCLWSA